MSLSDFLKNLPIHNSENFSKLNNTDGYARFQSDKTWFLFETRGNVR
jgi:hypothetical protein